MFSVFFMALKRIVDKTLAPLLVGIVSLAIEFFMGGISWIFVKVADILIGLIGGLLSVIPFPDVVLNDDTFGAQFLDIASIAGVWPAALLYLAGAVTAFISRLITLGLVGK